MSPPCLLRWISQGRHLSRTPSASHSMGRRGSLGASGQMVWSWTSLLNTRTEFIPGCFLTSFNLCISNFPGLHCASFPAVQCYWFQWDFSMCWSAGRGAAELDFSDQGQLHLRSLTLCSLSSAPLLITAHVFPAECKGVTVSLENDACVDSQSKCVVMGNLWCSILKGCYHESC